MVSHPVSPDLLIRQVTQDCLLFQLRKDDLDFRIWRFREIELHIIARMLEGVPFFKQLERKQRAGLARIMEVECLPGGSTVFKEGDLGDTFYVLVQGALRMTKDIGGAKLVHLSTYTRESNGRAS